MKLKIKKKHFYLMFCDDLLMNMQVRPRGAIKQLLSVLMSSQVDVKVDVMIGR